MTESSARSAAQTTMTQRGLIGAVLLAFLLSGGLAFSASNDEMNPPQFQMPKTGMKSGHITAKYEKSVGISGTDYAFHPKVEFWTNEGGQLEWKEFKRDDEVQFHLKQGKVDYLILIQPK